MLKNKNARVKHKTKKILQHGLKIIGIRVLLSSTCTSNHRKQPQRGQRRKRKAALQQRKLPLRQTWWDKHYINLMEKHATNESQAEFPSLEVIKSLPRKKNKTGCLQSYNCEK